jgi:RNA polymerase sigma-70 factor (ECF subfamily)
VGAIVQLAPSDEELLVRLQRGERSALDLLVRRYERELFGYLCRYLNDEELAEDVFQNTFLQVFLKIEQFEPGRAARPWLYAIATHQAIDALRRQQRRRDRTSLWEDRSGDEESAVAGWNLVAAEEVDSPLDILERAEQQTLIRQAVTHLPPLLRSVVLLVYFQGLKYHEAAEVLGIPVGTVKSRLHTAMKKLLQTCSPSETLQEPAQQATAPLRVPWPRPRSTAAATSPL